MPGLRFEWDEAKDRLNRRKHRVSFREAETVFLDERALLIADLEHSTAEDRVLLGLSATLRMLLVCHCYRKGSNLIRLISARRATRKEREQYEQRWSK